MVDGWIMWLHIHVLSFPICRPATKPETETQTQTCFKRDQFHIPDGRSGEIFFNEIHLFLSTAWESDQPTDQRPICRVALDFINNQLEKVHLELHKQQRLKTTVKHFFWILNDPQKYIFVIFQCFKMTMEMFDQEER